MILLLILLNGTWTSGAGAIDRDWKEGDILTHDFTYKYEQELISPDGKITSRLSSENVGNFQVNISGVNEDQSSYIVTYASNDLFKMEKKAHISFNASIVGGDLATAIVDFIVKIIVENGQVHLVANGPLLLIYFMTMTNIELGSGTPYLINPDWKIVKKEFLDVWKETRPVPTDVVYPQPVNYTLGDLWKDAVSFKLMGKSSLEEARQALTDETHEWTMEYDFSGVVEQEVYARTSGNSLQHEFQPYDTFTGKIEIEYTKGGTLKRIFISSNQEIKSLDEGTIKTVITYEFRLDQGGGLLPGVKVDISPISVFFGLGVIATAALLFRKKKEN